jgi:hypothetical protein
MNPGQIDMLFNDMRRLFKYLIRRLLIPRFPVPDPIRLQLLIIPDNDIIFQGFIPG